MALKTCSKCGKQYFGAGCPDCDYPPTVPDVSEARRRRLVGSGLLAVGIYCLAAFLVERNVALLAVALIFALAGVQLVAGMKGRVSALMGGLVCAGFSVLGFLAAFGHGPIEGGIPFLPHAWNQKIGKFVFGGGACISAMMAIYFLRQSLKPKSKL
jgi:hypothetical protein